MRSSVLRFAALALLLAHASATRAPSARSKEGIAAAKEVASPSTKWELLSLIDPLEAASAPCAPAGADAVAGDRAVAPSGSGGALSDETAFAGYNCKAMCDGKPLQANGAVHGADVDCWGKFRWFCKSNTSCSGVVGVKCDGHYTFYKDDEEGKGFAMCDGLLKYFHVRTSTCPATGASVRKFMGSACLGSSFSKMHSTPSARAAAAATVADMAADAAGATAAPIITGGHAGLLGTQHGQLLAALHAMGARGTGRIASGAGGVYEGKCEGLGGEVKGVKKLEAASAAVPEPQYDSVDQLEDAVEAALNELGLPSPLTAAPDKSATATRTKAAPPLAAPPASIFAALLPAAKAKVDLGDGRHLDCELTCNGKEPWLHGALPCWGELALSCEGERADEGHGTNADVDEGNAAHAAQEAKREARKRAGAAAQRAAALAMGGALPASRTAFAAVHEASTAHDAAAEVLPEQAAAAAAVVRDASHRKLLAAVQEVGLAGGLRTPVFRSSSTFEFDASCKGFWTGWFGKRCFGLTSTHGVFESDYKDVEMWGLCTGKHGIGAKKGKDGYAMGQWCKGHSAKGVVVEKHETPSPPPAGADAARVVPITP